MLSSALKYYKNFNFERLHYNYFFLDKKEISLLDKFKTHNIESNIATIFSLDENTITQQGILGASLFDVFRNLKKRTLGELNKSNTGDLKLGITKRNFLVSSEIVFLELGDIEKGLIEDIDDYISMLDDTRQDIALSRWGFARKKETLYEISERYGVTRERIRQLEARINNNLPLYLRVHPRVLWQHIREKMTEDLTCLLPKLSRCFESDKDFYSFIELCCQGQVKSGDLLNIADPQVKSNLLNLYFCNVASPVPYDTLMKELISFFGYSPSLAINTLRELRNLKSIKIIENFIYPSNLRKSEAVAHALINHPNGLPWKDIVKIINRHGYCSTKINENRFINYYFGDSDYIYSCGRGTYRHLMYLDLSKIDTSKIIKNVVEYFRSNKIIKINLYDYYYKSNLSQDIEYFSLRYIIKTFGFDFGIYFYGKSGVDGLSLDQKSPQITQSEVVLQAFIDAKYPMTKQEIADRLRSKSLRHANLYLNKLITEGKVIRVDYMTYSTPEKAFRNLDLCAITQIMNKILKESNKIVESDVFRLEINRELNLSYSKYFYSAIASIESSKFGWFKRNNLISVNKFEYHSLTEIIKDNVVRSMTDEENISNIKKIVFVTDIVLDMVLNNFKNNHLENLGNLE